LPNAYEERDLSRKEEKKILTLAVRLISRFLHKTGVVPTQ
jgi:hypothetical protein